MDLTAHPQTRGLFTLSPEFRIEIYTHRLTGLQPSSLHIHRLPNNPARWLLRAHSGIHCPPVLRTY